MKNYTLNDRPIEFSLIFLIVFTPIAYGAVLPWSIALFEVIAALMLLFRIFKTLKTGKLEYTKNPFTLLISLFVIYVLFQFFFTLGPHPSSLIPLVASDVSNQLLYAPGSMPYAIFGSIYIWSTKTELLKLVSYALIFLITLNTIKTREQINRILSIIIAVGFIMGILYLMRHLGVEAPRGFINRDHFSAYLGMIIPIALGFLFVRQQNLEHGAKRLAHGTKTDSRDTRYAKGFLLFFCAVVMGGALFFTMSRGGMLSFIGALLVMGGLALSRKSLKKKAWILSVVAIFIILIIAWLGATPVIEKILSIKVEIASLYFNGRFPIWQGTVDIIKDYPVFGTGFGTFDYAFPKYEPIRFSSHYYHAHSDFLELISEVGIAGFSIFIVCGLSSVVWFFRRFSKRHEPYVLGMSIGFFGSITTIFVHSFTDFSLHIPANAILLSIILALFISILNVDHRPPSKQPAGKQTSNYRTLNISRTAKVILYPISVLLVVMFIIASVRPAIADYYYSRALSAESKGPSNQSSIINLQSSIKFDPSDAKYHYELGKAYYEQVMNLEPQTLNLEHLFIQMAIDNYKKAIALNPTNSKYHQSLAWSYGQLADLLQTSLQTTGPDSSGSPHSSDGQALHHATMPNKLALQTTGGQAGKNKPADKQTSVEQYTDLAHIEFELAIAWEPNNPYRHRTYAVWLFNHPTEENIEKGVFEYSRAIEIEPQIAEQAFDRYFAITGDYASLTEIIPNTADGYLSLAGHLNRKGLKKESIQMKQKAIPMFIKEIPSVRLKEQIQKRRKLAGVYNVLNENDKAVKEYQILLIMDSQNSGAYYINMGRIYKKMGRQIEARAIWQAILDLKKIDPRAQKIAIKELKNLEH